MRKSIQSLFPITIGTAFKNSTIKLTNHSILIVSLPRFVADCGSASGIKRESGASPELSRSCKSRRREVHTLTATVR